MDHQRRIAAAGFIFMGAAYLLQNKPRKRRWWMLTLNQTRARQGGIQLMADLLKEPSGKFENFCRISSEDFEMLLQKVAPLISRRDTQFRSAISAKERLAVTLRFLASGDNFTSLQYTFKMSPQSISNIVPEVCAALIKVLENEIKTPKTTERWMEIAGVFEKTWNFPHCVGAVDGKHVVIQSPVNSGSDYFNYKDYFSIVLMAVVDADYCFIFADCGAKGSSNDSTVYQDSKFYSLLMKDQLNLPADKPLPGRNKKDVPFFFVGDDAFALSRRMMKGYPGMHVKGTQKRIYNYRLCRARRVVENAFGIMSSVFRVMRKPMLLDPSTASVVTMACVTLHNFLRRSRTSNGHYNPPGTFDYEENGVLHPGSWRRESEGATSLLPLTRVPRRSNLKAKEIRDEVADWVFTDGKVSWQDEYC